MDTDTQNVVKELAKLQVASRMLVKAVEALEGVEIPYETAKLLAVTSDVVRVALGEESKLSG